VTIATHEATIEDLEATIEAQRKQILELEERLKARCSCQGAKIDEKEWTLVNYDERTIL